jgi:MinD-like ATPase involved in chromosome partitioning or flagellar assembly
VLGREPDVLIPSDRDVVRSINAGQAIVTANPRSEPAKAFKALAEMHLAVPAAQDTTTTRRRKTLLRRG